MARLYERHKFPYLGDTEAMEEFLAKGGMIGTTIGRKGSLMPIKMLTISRKSCRIRSLTSRLSNCG
ncbi:hypothetical protein PHJA_001349900 [Phtheirospermum japonicum]|uniref:Uncharacterized protein n=1 Tax=Phtheirospermum japonicum TaxID=374723 RepID=A0A830C4L1_9LAMI|nr:hypothetical protein PHJA_001349900 [Phtheirospermum japonicum]